MQPDRTDQAVDTVLHSLMTVGRSMRQRIHPDDLDPGTFWLLKTIGHQGPIRATDLAAASDLDTSTVSRHVSQLERSGLVHREPDPDDGRAQLVALSPAGRSLLDQAYARRRAIVTASIAAWPDADLTEFERLLTKFITDLQTTTDSASELAGTQQKVSA